MKDRPTQLTWWPRDPAEWLTRTMSLAPDARAAYDSLRCHAWLAHSHGDRPCSIPADDASLARLAGMTPAQWRKVAVVVLPFFTSVGNLYVDEDLLRTWETQLRKYNKRLNAGSKGGKAKALRTQSGSKATTMSKHQDRSSSLREEHYGAGGALPSGRTPARGGPTRITDILRAAGVPKL